MTVTEEEYFMTWCNRGSSLFHHFFLHMLTWLVYFMVSSC